MSSENSAGAGTVVVGAARGGGAAAAVAGACPSVWYVSVLACLTGRWAGGNRAL